MNDQNVFIRTLRLFIDGVKMPIQMIEDMFEHITVGLISLTAKQPEKEIQMTELNDDRLAELRDIVDEKAYGTDRYGETRDDPFFRDILRALDELDACRQKEKRRERRKRTIKAGTPVFIRNMDFICVGYTMGVCRDFGPMLVQIEYQYLYTDPYRFPWVEMRQEQRWVMREDVFLTQREAEDAE